MVFNDSSMTAGIRVVPALACLAIAAARGTPPGSQPPITNAAIAQSTDVALLERVVSSPESILTGADRFSTKALRTAAYARLGELGTSESLAAVDRIEQLASRVSLTPPTVPADIWPSAAWHMSDTRVVPLAETKAPDGTTYAVVSAILLGGSDFFLISSRTPEDRRSWSRPRLIAPNAHRQLRDAVLVWRQPGTLVLSFGPASQLEISLVDVERDSDGDGWTDREEDRLGLNPHDPDTDGDGMLGGADVCPLYAAPKGDPSDEALILQKAVFAAFALTGSRQLLYVTPGVTKIQVSGYGGPIIYDRPIPKDGAFGGPYVSWTIKHRSAADALVEITDWEGALAAGGQDVSLKKIAGRWVVVARRTTWVS